jgi:hypothetical protein
MPVQSLPMQAYKGEKIPPQGSEDDSSNKGPGCFPRWKKDVEASLGILVPPRSLEAIAGFRCKKCHFNDGRVSGILPSPGLANL